MVSADLYSLMIFFLEWHDEMTSARKGMQLVLYIILSFQDFNPDVVGCGEEFVVELLEAGLG